MWVETGSPASPVQQCILGTQFRAWPRGQCREPEEGTGLLLGVRSGSHAAPRTLSLGLSFPFPETTPDNRSVQHAWGWGHDYRGRDETWGDVDSERHSMGGGRLGEPQSPKCQARSEEEKQRLPSSCPTESVLLPARFGAPRRLAPALP